MRQMIPDAEELSPAWLTAFLRQAGILPTGHVRACYCSATLSPTCVKYHLNVEYSIDAPVSAPLRLFLKYARRDRDARLINAAGEKEVKMYRHFLDNSVDLPVLRCYNVVAMPEHSYFHLLFDDLSLTHEQPASRQAIADHYLAQTIDCFATHHAYWWEHPLLGKGIGDLTDLDSLTNFHAHWWEQQRRTLNVEQLTPTQKSAAEIHMLCDAFPHFIDHLADLINRKDRMIYERLLGCLQTFWDRPLTIEGKTLVHGDAHFWNIFYPRDPHQGRTVLFDWQTYFVGPGTADLAHLLILRDPRRTPSRERELVWRYFQQLQERRSLHYSWESCWLDYRRSAVEQLLFPLRWYARHYTSKLGEYWEQYVTKALAAFHDLRCEELIPD